MQTFNNFFEAQSRAWNLARKQVGRQQPSIVFDDCGLSLNDPYYTHACNIYSQALKEAYANIFRAWIYEGSVKDCILTRRWMEDISYP